MCEAEIFIMPSDLQTNFQQSSRDYSTQIFKADVCCVFHIRDLRSGPLVTFLEDAIPLKVNTVQLPCFALLYLCLMETES